MGLKYLFSNVCTIRNQKQLNLLKCVNTVLTFTRAIVQYNTTSIEQPLTWTVMPHIFYFIRLKCSRNLYVEQKVVVINYKYDWFHDMKRPDLPGAAELAHGVIITHRADI